MTVRGIRLKVSIPNGLGKPDPIGNPHIHAASTNRGMNMGGIPGNPDPIHAIGIDLSKMHIEITFPRGLLNA